jgi:hypothetical protein
MILDLYLLFSHLDFVTSHVVDRLRSLVIDKLKSKVISGNSEDTFDNVKKIIHNCKLKIKVLPLQSKQRKIVRIFGMKEEELDIIKKFFSFVITDDIYEFHLK